jgi:soluble lytic murein transglycosylase-like protein
VFPRRFHPVPIAAAVALACIAAPAAHAFDRVTLRNGFSYDCAHREALADGRVRLFLNSENSSYIDLPAAEIESIATLPDPPAAAPKTSAPANADVRSLLSHAGEEHDIDVELLASLVHAESGGHAHAISRTGAQGLMQLMPSTAHNLGVKDSFQPDQNINGGTAYLDALLKKYHDNLALALAAYNAGPAAVDKYHGIPPYRETRTYVARVMTEFKRRKLQLAHQQTVQTASVVATQR